MSFLMGNSGALGLFGFGLNLLAQIAPSQFAPYLAYAGILCVLVALVWFLQSSVGGSEEEKRENRLVAKIAAATNRFAGKRSTPSLTDQPATYDTSVLDAFHYLLHNKRWLLLGQGVGVGVPDGLTESGLRKRLPRWAAILEELRGQACKGSLVIAGRSQPTDISVMLKSEFWIQNRLTLGSIVSGSGDVRTECPSAPDQLSFGSLTVARTQVEQIWPPEEP